MSNVQRNVWQSGRCPTRRPDAIHFFVNFDVSNSFFLDCVHMLGVVPHQGGLPGQPVRVTRLGRMGFLYVKAAKWGSPPNRGNQITRAGGVISTISPPKPPKR